ncbi:MAG TPA: hypothetical protein PKH97_05470 [Tetrasphaera sp.]|uniref:hypothetical protein n=1 Tax=Nostocoides sp. TaxID=1917966 RepID=UPI002CCF60CB|nr:hypothetical protein [Tetrasphaera sp.]HNQ06620.1 hypothetical protein [Tetrasphaera sp.]
MKLTKTSIGAVIAAGALTLSACGSSDGTSSTSGAAASGTGTQSTAATTATSATTTASETTSAAETTDAGGGGSTDIAGAKVGDEIDAIALGQAMQKVFVDGATGHMKMDMGGSITAEGDFKVVKGKQDMAMTMEMMGTKIDMITIGGVSYMKGLTGGTKWVKMDAAEAAGAGAGNLNSFDPAVMAKAFGGQKAKVTKKEGDLTTLSLDLDLAKVMSATGMDKPTGITLPDSIPVTYTLDGQGRPVHSTINMGMEITVDYSDWGKKVDISAPPASQVTTM